MEEIAQQIFGHFFEYRVQQDIVALGDGLVTIAMGLQRCNKRVFYATLYYLMAQQQSISQARRLITRHLASFPQEEHNLADLLVVYVVQEATCGMDIHEAIEQSFAGYELYTAIMDRKNELQRLNLTKMTELYKKDAVIQRIMQQIRQTFGGQEIVVSEVEEEPISQLDAQVLVELMSVEQLELVSSTKLVEYARGIRPIGSQSTNFTPRIKSLPESESNTRSSDRQPVNRMLFEHVSDEETQEMVSGSPLSDSWVPLPSQRILSDPPPTSSRHNVGKAPLLSDQENPFINRKSFGRGFQKVKWTQQEVDALEAGIQQYGYGNWATILDNSQGQFHPRRTNIDLKDKVRTERTRRRNQGLSEGFFAQPLQQ